MDNAYKELERFCPQIGIYIADRLGPLVKLLGLRLKTLFVLLKDSVCKSLERTRKGVVKSTHSIPGRTPQGVPVAPRQSRIILMGREPIYSVTVFYQKETICTK